LPYAPLPMAAIRALAELTQHVRAEALDVPEVDWNVCADHLVAGPRAQFDRDLVAIRSRYEYALKTMEYDKVLNCVSGLRKFADFYDAPDALQIAGRMLWALGRREQARDCFADAADKLNDSLLRSQAGSASELSPLLRFHLERCQYWGVRAPS